MQVLSASDNKVSQEALLLSSLLWNLGVKNLEIAGAESKLLPKLITFEQQVNHLLIPSCFLQLTRISKALA